MTKFLLLEGCHIDNDPANPKLERLYRRGEVVETHKNLDRWPEKFRKVHEDPMVSQVTLPGGIAPDMVSHSPQTIPTTTPQATTEKMAVVSNKHTEASLQALSLKQLQQICDDEEIPFARGMANKADLVKLILTNQK